MKIAIVINDFTREKGKYTSMRLAVAASNRGHAVWVFGAGDFHYGDDGKIYARARRATRSNHKSSIVYLDDLRGGDHVEERIVIDELDVLLLRNDPALDAGERAWAQTSPLIFGRIAKQRGVLVLNDPDGLTRASSKMYLEEFPPEVRPRTIVTRSPKEIRDFADRESAPIILKPLRGSGGQNVFLLRPEEKANLKQIVGAISRDGYVIAQEYLPDAAAGDIRLFMMNGDPLRYKGKYAAFRRLIRGDDVRSNAHAGGENEQVELDRAALELAQKIKPKLIEDGMFFVGLDIVGSKIMEINVFSPGGLGVASRYEGVAFNSAVIQSLERKVSYRDSYSKSFDNIALATM